MTGFLLRRVRAHRLLLAAALLSVVLATSVLAALAAFSTAIGDAGLRRALQHQSASRTVLDVHSDVTGGDRRATDAEIRRAAHRSFDGLPVSVAASTSSGPYALPEALRPAEAADSGERGDGEAGSGDGGEPDLTRFTSLDPRHVRMVAGSWPDPARAGGPVFVAVPQQAAKRLGLRPGDTFEVTSRLSGPPPVKVEVTGVFTPRSPGSPYWRLDPLKGDGVSVLDFTTYGPLAVPDGSFSTRTDPRARDDRKAESRAASENETDDRAVRGDSAGGGPLWPTEARWQARADFAGVSAARLDALRDHVRQAADRFGSSRAAPDAAATTELPGLLDSLERTLLVTRSTLLIAALQLVLLTGLSLLLVAQLLRAERESETALLRARGASRARVCGLAVAEALLLALPAALVAPLLAGPAVRWATGHGALARAGVGPVLRLPAGIWWVAACTALGCAVVVALPTLRGRGGAGEEDPENGVERTARADRRGRGRGRRTAAALLRGGADLALVGLAVTAYWQLERRSEGTGVLSSGEAGAGGALGIDPVLVAAPALALLAGTVLVLRLLPLVARAGERGAARGRGLAAALAGWQLSRRPLRGAAPALLLVLAVATGVFAVGQGASWDRSQGDQADFRTGADVATSDSVTSALAQGGIYDGTDGVRAVAPVARTSFTVEGERSAQVIATDTRSAADGTLRMRGDLADVPLPRLLRPLAPGGKRAEAGRGAGLRLPRGTRELRVRVRLDGPRGGARRDGSGAPRGAQERGGSVPDTQEALTLTLEDRFGVPYRFPLDRLPADGRAHTLTARLTSGGSTPARSLRLTGLALSYAAPDAGEERTLTVESLRATGEHGTRALHPDRAERWSTRVRADDPQGTLGRGASYARPEPGPARLHTSGAPLTFPYTTGSAPPTSDGEPVPVSLELRPGEGPHGTGSGTGTGNRAGTGAGTSAESGKGGGGDGAATLPAVATDAYLRATGAKVGDKVTARISDQELTVRLTAAVRALPTEERGASVRRGDAGALLVDLAALDRLLVDLGGTPLEPLGWWLEAEPGAARHVAAQLRAEPAVGTVRVRDEVAAELRGDPLGAGPRSALTAIALAAAVLAATGFAVSVAGAARERAGEFAVLRALGASRRRLAQALAAEQGVLLLLSAALGLALGTLLTRLVVPLIVLTPEATLPVPALLVRLPPGPLALLLAAVLALPTLAVTATALRRTDPVAALRTERGD